jgi:hypothetical protein
MSNVTVSFIDPTLLPANAIFVSTTSITDTQILTFLVGAGLIICLVLFYLLRLLSESILQSFDYFSTSFNVISTSVIRGSLKPYAKTSSFGGLISILGVITGATLVVVVLLGLEVSRGFVNENSVTSTSLDSNPLTSSNGLVTITLYASRLSTAPIVGTGICRLLSLTSSSNIQTQFQLVSVMDLGRPNSSNLASYSCGFVVQSSTSGFGMKSLSYPSGFSPSIVDPTQPISVQSTVGLVSIGLDNYFQLTSFSVVVNDGKPSCYTQASPISVPIVPNFVNSKQHLTQMLLSPSNYTDVSGWSSSTGPSPVTNGPNTAPSTSGYRASVPIYIQTVTNNSVSIGDSFLLAIAPSGQSIMTIATPKLANSLTTAILLLLGILYGLSLGVFGMSKGVYELFDSLFSCSDTRHPRSRTKASNGNSSNGCCNRRKTSEDAPNSSDFSSSTPEKGMNTSSIEAALEESNIESQLQVKATTFYMTPQQLAQLSVLAELMEQNSVFMTNLQQLASVDIAHAAVGTGGVPNPSPSPSRKGIAAVAMDDDETPTDLGHSRAPFGTVGSLHYSKKILSTSAIAHPKQSNGNVIHDVDIGLGKNYDKQNEKLFTARPNSVFAHTDEMKEKMGDDAGHLKPAFQDVAFDTGLQRGVTDDGIIGVQENPTFSHHSKDTKTHSTNDHHKVETSNPVFIQNPTYHPVRKTSRVSDLFK